MIELADNKANAILTAIGIMSIVILALIGITGNLFNCVFGYYLNLLF